MKGRPAYSSRAVGKTCSTWIRDVGTGISPCRHVHPLMETTARGRGPSLLLKFREGHPGSYDPNIVSFFILPYDSILEHSTVRNPVLHGPCYHHKHFSPLLPNGMPATEEAISGRTTVEPASPESPRSHGPPSRSRRPPPTSVRLSSPPTASALSRTKRVFAENRTPCHGLFHSNERIALTARSALRT